MTSRFSSHLRHNLVAYLALFIALGGTSYAAVRLPKNSVGTKQIKRNAVNSSKVANGRLLAADFAPGQLPRGATGERGASGEPGASGATNVTVRSAADSRTETRTCPGTGVGTTVCEVSSEVAAVARCLPGERATGGEVNPEESNGGFVEASRPDPSGGTPTGWFGRSGGFGEAFNDSGGPATASATARVKIYVICAAP